ncbi:TIGR03773 family transporter-associated surface protein [Yinghuangia sp. ASG 101]|uniref:TIGR03773 family transporter-associated surface protein n=1 Tax=Yinghuangia sp. ASG 101 TaxID=2896848 RepID=UPI001E4BB8AA|nr:TIGR03773 family transporter-associated surface protein [Yinghuangia sp. ASG 101]UGQ13946.1 TIGR03773 family transporter-associated surface protein [Yinghuangia sp. ASG 101]
MPTNARLRSALASTAAGAGTLALLASAAGPALAEPSPTPAVPVMRTSVGLAHGELDVGVTTMGGLSCADAGKSPGAACDLLLGPEARGTAEDAGLPADFGSPGTPIWRLADGPAGAAPVFDTREVPADALAVPDVVWTISAVEGPGRVAVWSDTGVLFDTGDDMADAAQLPAGQVTDTAWAFGAPGAYRVSVAVEVTLGTGETKRDTADWTVLVDDEQPLPAETPKPPEPTPDPTVPPGPEQKSPAATAVAQSAPAVAVPRVGAPASVSALAAVAVDSSPVTIDRGHVDALAGTFADGRLRLLFKDSREPAAVVWRAPSAVTLRVGDPARTTVPTGSAYGFLGAAGQPLWIIPQTQNPAVVWAGWNTEELTARELAGPVTLTLTGVEGPGSVAVWEDGSFGRPKVIFDSANGLPDRHEVPLGVHAHANWGFGAPGTYRLTVRLTGTLASGGTAEDTATYTIVVDSAPGSGSASGSGTAGSGTTGAGTSASGSGATGTTGTSGATTTTGSSGGTSSSGGSTGSGGTGGSTGSAATGPLARTGATEPIRLIWGGTALLLLGTVVVVVTRRRNSARRG